MVSSEVKSFDMPNPLTKRELEILRLMASGYSNKEIAQAFDAVEGTVKIMSRAHFQNLVCVIEHCPC
jgi:DNA-binding NarL/FixJ family response regulator